MQSKAFNLRRVVPVPPACDPTMVPVPSACGCAMVPVPPACDCTMMPVPVRTCLACFAGICLVSPKEGDTYSCVNPSSHSSQTSGLHLSGPVPYIEWGNLQIKSYELEGNGWRTRVSFFSDALESVQALELFAACCQLPILPPLIEHYLLSRLLLYVELGHQLHVTKPQRMLHTLT